jgi:hypothetical protein
MNHLFDLEERKKARYRIYPYDTEYYEEEIKGN